MKQNEGKREVKMIYWRKNDLALAWESSISYTGINLSMVTDTGTLAGLVIMTVLVAQLCMTLCEPMNCSPSGSSVHGILKTKMLEWVAIPFSSGSSQPRDQTWVSCIAGSFFTIWATREAPGVAGKSQFWLQVGTVSLTSFSCFCYFNQT